MRRFFLVALLGSMPFMVGCANAQQYMGIQLKGEESSFEVRELASRAKAGDKQAQLDLGIAFEEGLGVERDLDKARRLYALAAASIGGWQYGGLMGSTGSVVPRRFYSGYPVAGLEHAKVRLAKLKAMAGPSSGAQTEIPDSDVTSRYERALPSTYSESDFQEQMRTLITRPDAAPEVLYEGKFYGLLKIEGFVYFEAYNSVFGSDTIREDDGPCRSIETALAAIWSGSMTRCDAKEWNYSILPSSNITKNKDRIFTINYWFPEEPLECEEIRDCVQNLFTTVSYEPNTCGWFAYYRFSTRSGANLLFLESMDPKYLSKRYPKIWKRIKARDSQRNSLCNIQNSGIPGTVY